MRRSLSVLVKQGWNQRQIKTSFETGRITQRRWNQTRARGRFVYPWWSVDVGGLCFRNIQISLFKILWYLTLGTDKKTLAWTWTRLGMCNGALLCFSYRFNLLYFPPFQLLFSVHPHAQRGCQFSIDYSTIKVMVILNNMTCIAYSWKRWLTYSQFIGIMVWPPAGWRHFLKSK